MKINGPIEIVYGVTALLFVIAIALLLGKGSWMIAGYNTASEAKKGKYDVKKLCKITGGGIGIIGVLFLVTCFIWDKVPNYFTYILTALIMFDCIIMIILANTIGKKKII